MANYVENHISFYGNKEVHALTAEVNRRLKETPDIPTVLYGTSFADDAEALKKMGAIYVDEANGEFGDEAEICLKSDNNAPEQLENHLIWFYSKVDPTVVMCNYYAHCNGDFIGVRYKFVSKSKIKTIEEYRSTAENVVFAMDLSDYEDEEEDHITWHTLSDRHFDLNELVRERLITSYPDKAQNFRR